MNFELISFANADELAARTAGLWLDEVETANRIGKPHCVALSGGRIARTFFTAIVAQAEARNSLFHHVHFFWADERCVPPDDPESNFKLANELLFKLLKIPENRIHRIRGEAPPEIAVKMANEEIRSVISNSKVPVPARFPAERGAVENFLPVLDLVFLGMGEDGHVASLFPSAPSEVVNSALPFVAVENSPKPPPKRISLSYAAIAAASQVWTLVSGAGKTAALRASLNPNGQTPLARVVRSRAGTKIFCDF